MCNTARKGSLNISCIIAVSSSERYRKRIARNFQWRTYGAAALALRAVTTNSNADAIRRADDEYQLVILASPLMSNKRMKLDLHFCSQLFSIEIWVVSGDKMPSKERVQVIAIKLANTRFAGITKRGHCDVVDSIILRSTYNLTKVEIRCQTHFFS